jgi:peptidoglycan/xylan/chitin deacetylase (PgdA/CDA1 family)
MSEVLDYLRTLRRRDPWVVMRELRSRFVRGSAKHAVRRVMDLCEQKGAAFTFFLTGNCAVANRGFVREILDRGHSIACHGYNHLRLDSCDQNLARRDIRLAKRVYDELFGYHLRGFRAPYLGISEALAAIVKDEDLGWSSSIMDDGRGPRAYNCGLPELPIAACDWHTLIRNNASGRDFADELAAKAKASAVFELHPWRMGQRRFIWILEEFLDRCPVPLVSVDDLARGAPGMALSGDIGELGLAEVLWRATGGRANDHSMVERRLDRGWN